MQHAACCTLPRTQALVMACNGWMDIAMLIAYTGCVRRYHYGGATPGRGLRMMRGTWNLGSPKRHGGGRATMAIGLIAVSLLLPLRAVHADSNAHTTVDAKAGPFARFNKGLRNGKFTDETGASDPADTGLRVSATTTSIQITYTGGVIMLYRPDPSNNPALTPDGTASGSKPLPYGTPTAKTPVPLTSARYGQLLYRIGPEGSDAVGVVFPEPVVSGSSVTITPPPGATGELYLFINDTQYYDNDGAYNVDVALTDPVSVGTRSGIHADGTATPEAPAGLLLALGMLPLAGVVAWRRRAQRP